MTEEMPKPSAVNVNDIDRLLHEPARLQIMALLYVVDKADFLFVLDQTGLTWGNLSSHLAKLESSEYVKIEKAFKGKRPNTSIQLTPRGRQMFKEYAARMKRLVAELPE
jgi:DNA-binding transcriptional ArsR family regulator